MACPMNLRSLVTVKVKDGTAVTPLEMTILYTATLTITPGGYALSDVYTHDGEFAGTPPVKGQAQATTIELSDLELQHEGDDGTALQLVDLISQTGYYDTLVSTTDTAGNCENGEKTFDLELNWTHDGTTAQQVFSQCTFSGTLTHTLEPSVASLTVTSRQPYPTYE